MDETWEAGGQVCVHLAEQELTLFDVYYQFTGRGTAYHCLCHNCAQNPAAARSLMQQVSAASWQEIDQFPHEGIIGSPKILERTTTLQFEHQITQLNDPLPGSILDIHPLNSRDSEWLALLDQGQIVRLNLTSQQHTVLYTLPTDALPLTPQTRLVLAASRFIAVVQDYDSAGVVIDLALQTITMRLNRGAYHVEQTPFPAVFFSEGGKAYLIHATDWNRLDISNPETGDLLTSRETVRLKDAPSPDHYLDYFHGKLHLSPDSNWLVDDGWVWHPIGTMRLWNVRRWLHQNKWESEDGQSVRTLVKRAYLWDIPISWIDDQTLAVWGFGDDEEWMIPAVQLFDRTTGTRKFWFAGVESGVLVFDRYLFSASVSGLAIWDITTGERLHHDPDCHPTHYHHATKQFLSLLPDQQFCLSRLIHHGEVTACKSEIT